MTPFLRITNQWLIACFLISSSFLFSQTPKIDSLLTVIKAAKEDTNQVNAYMKLLREYKALGDLDQLMSASRQLMILAEKLKSTKGITESYNMMGMAYKAKGNYDKALEYYLKVLKIKESIGDKRAVANVNNNIGNLYYSQNNIKRSLEYHFKALELRREVNDKVGVATSLNNIGLIYNSLNELDKARKHLEEALVIWQELDDQNHVADSYNNIGLVIERLGDKLLAQGDRSKANEEFNRSINYQEKALKMKEASGDKRGLANANGNIANIYVKLKKFTEAEQKYFNCLQFFKEEGDRESEVEVYTNMALLYYEKGDFKEACEYQVKYAKLKDTLFSKESAKQMSEMNAKYETEKKDKELLKKDADLLKQEAESARQQAQRNIFIVGFGLVLLLALFIFRGYRAKQKANRIITLQKEEVERQKHLVEEQKEIVEDKQKEIIDSISYAKRLQEAILPSEKEISEYLPGTFLLYLPKDIVAGDFYWMERVGDSVLIAAADSTGHGVPGAMVSVVCSNALHRTVMEFGITEPGKILDNVRKMVVQTFSKSDKDVKDGMDISLALLNPKTRQLQWAGANNPLWYLHEGEVKEITANKQPIGKTDNPVPFVTHTIQLDQNDMIFLFTDGYADQFGGPHGKKLKYKPFKEMLQKISKENPVVQKQLLHGYFADWKGVHEQVDDVCVIGIRI